MSNFHYIDRVEHKKPCILKCCCTIKDYGENKNCDSFAYLAANLSICQM